MIGKRFVLFVAAYVLLAVSLIFLGNFVWEAALERQQFKLELGLEREARVKLEKENDEIKSEIRDEQRKLQQQVEEIRQSILEMMSRQER